MAGKDVTIVCMGKEQKDIVVDDVLLPVVSRELIYFNADVDCSLATDCEGILWLQDYARAKKCIIMLLVMSYCVVQLAIG